MTASVSSARGLTAWDRGIYILSEDVGKRTEPITFQTVRAIGLKLQGAEDGTTYGSPALKVNGQMFACMAINKSVEPETLAVRVPFDQRKDLLTEAPDTYYVTDHYIDYPIVLVRLARVHRDALADLLRAGHQFVSTEKRHPRNRRRRRLR